ncbi:hypothetical protein EW146_g180 [Bondarzewia mesenterica]|uniref:Serine/threonine-protein phosphatase n=1 Tax=Bondarzewia mesenterica TaxID=1095465 RepID=A0A4S4M7Q1_9AGAM|nr:hypothetical protein EW146_g180 [Bondarzewia mesenterica]
MSDSSPSIPSSPAPSSTLPSSIPSPALSSLSLTDPNEVSEEDKNKALKLKAEANKAFTSHAFPQAAELYSQAIEKNPFDATLFCNRAYTRLKLEEHGYALQDASLKFTYSLPEILKPQLAVADLKKVVALEPHNKQVKAQLESTQKLVRRIEFEKAIEVEGEPSAVERCLEIIAEGGCELDKKYDGPKLQVTEDGRYKITLGFVESMIQWFRDGKALPRRYVWEIVLGAHSCFVQEQSLVELSLEEGTTCDVIGDVHGQYYDMLHLYSLTGPPMGKHCLLMNGDLVDRGSWSIEVILTVLAYKWLYPKNMYINRGNHETREMNRAYGFEGEAKHKHGEQTYKLFAHLFTTMPLATLISATLPPKTKQGAILSPQGFKRYFVVHGGLFSRDGVTLDEISKIDRIGRQPGTEGLMCELLWTDPQETPGRGPSKRGVGIAFGPDVTRRWCELNGVTGILRSHEVRQDGYAIEHNGLCTTVFSAPNYVDQAGNKGAFVRIDDAGTQKYFQFEAQPHPDMKPMAYASIDDQKLSQYTQGTVRKSRREKEKEAAEAKRKEEEENAAKAYAEFIDAFDGEGASKRQSGPGFVRSSKDAGGAYDASVQQRLEGLSRATRVMEEDSGSATPPQGPKPKGKRAMDAFLEEIKKPNERPGFRDPFMHDLQLPWLHMKVKVAAKIEEILRYWYDSITKVTSLTQLLQQTSNVFVANLPPHVTEQSLGTFFARMGPVGSVKVMWPRGDAGHGPGADMTATRRNKNAGLSGFVSFMKRKDAEAALREFDGFDWGGSVLRVGWSKAVPLAAKPMYDQGRIPVEVTAHLAIVMDLVLARVLRIDSPTCHDDLVADRTVEVARHHHAAGDTALAHVAVLAMTDAAAPLADIDHLIITPKATKTTSQIYNLREREKGNAQYAFLTNPQHRKYKYYRSIVDRDWTADPEFDDEGYSSVFSTDSAEESERERTRKNKLGRLARKRFEAMLRSLSGTRGELARCMAFSLEHAEAANEVSDIIIASLVVDGTPVPRKIARLHLICDILHNSAAPLPMAWKFRQEFQSRLGLVFDHFSTIYHSFPGRITAETFKKQITSVVDIWEDWIVFAPDFTAELRQRIEGQTEEEASTPEAAPQQEQEHAPAFVSRFKASSFRPAEEAAEAEAPKGASADVDGEPMDEGSDAIDGEPVDDIDGQPIDEDVDGEPLDGEPIDDVDGEPMVEDDVDGEPMDDDIDGAPINV